MERLNLNAGRRRSDRIWYSLVSGWHSRPGCLTPGHGKVGWFYVWEKSLAAVSLTWSCRGVPKGVSFPKVWGAQDTRDWLGWGWPWHSLCWLLAPSVLFGAPRHAEPICKHLGQAQGEGSALRILWECHIWQIPSVDFCQWTAGLLLWLWCSHLATSGQPLTPWDHPEGSQNAEFRSNFSGLHVRKRESDGKVHIACVCFTNPCLQREVFAGSPSYRVSGGHLGYLQVSPGWPWLLPGVMEPSQWQSHTQQGHMEGTGVLCLEFVCLNYKHRNLRFKAYQRAQ